MDYQVMTGAASGHRRGAAGEAAHADAESAGRGRVAGGGRRRGGRRFLRRDKRGGRRDLRLSGWRGR